MISAATGRASRKRPASLLRYGFLGVLLCLALPLLGATTSHAQQPNPDKCASGELKPKTELNLSTTGASQGESQPDLQISGPCIVKVTGNYFYSKVNIIGPKGALIFQEGPSSDLDKVTNFWARSIIVENRGTMKAGVDDKPYGSNLHTLNIILYGKDLSAGHPEKTAAGGDTCVQELCGVPKTLWDTNGSGDKPTLDNGVQDYFYQYGQMYGTATGYFGYKVLAVGYGGTLQLYGLKGTTAGAAADNDYNNKKSTAGDWQSNSGSSWRRLAGGAKAGEDLKAGGKTLVLDRGVAGDWQPGDQIVITTTDYLPSHSEERTIDTVSKDTITLKDAVRWDHVGHRYDLSVLKNAGDGFKKAFPNQTPPASAETRAAVALLTRSIRIVSGGDVAGDYFDCPKNSVPKELSHDKTKDIPVAKENCATQRDSNYSFGAHTVFRQGFAKLQVQGVEFHQLGQGGRLGHYPVHFHMARQVPPDTYIKDSSVSESMTRWYVLHSTLGVTLQRNVGWKSIGHGYYLEDGTETDNKFYSNIGIYARGAVIGDQNPRNIPGILAINTPEKKSIYRSDVYYPTAFWITNGWNDFVGNMAAGAGTCGVCFWLHSALNSDMVEVQSGKQMLHMNWSGYSGIQAGTGNGGRAPLKVFYKNYCSTAMHSLFTTSDAISDCNGAQDQGNNDSTRIDPVKSIAPPRAGDLAQDMYYPHLKGNRYPTVCDPTKEGSCTGPYDKSLGYNSRGSAQECSNPDPATCAVTLIDQYTTSYHWAAKNFSAIWLRTPGWFLMDNSFISDVQNGGLTFVTGGDYSRSSTPLGYWGLVSHSIFVGETQPGSAYASAAGPPAGDKSAAASGKAVCDTVTRGDACVGLKDSVAYPKEDWSVGQRLFNIYDGPAYQDANAYLDIPTSKCDTSKPCMYAGVTNAATVPGVRRTTTTGTGGLLPNAAIGWKQPNGFYYPPAFNSSNLYFNKVAIRHYVIEPLLQPGTYLTDDDKVNQQFLGMQGQIGKMSSFTDVDRQTVLNDDDGTLTGFKQTISVNEDGFFSAPVQASQCRSNVGVDPASTCKPEKVTPPSESKQPPTARTSPYDYVTTVIYPGCAMDPNIAGGGDKPTDLIAACGSRRDDIDKAKTNEDNDKCENGNCDRITDAHSRGGDWSSECGGPYCYGVPIYRQYLTGFKKDPQTGLPSREWETWYASGCDKSMVDDGGKVKKGCKFPFTRMNGANEWQRDVLTVNNGKYFIDTTVGKETQQKTTDLGRPGTVQDQYVECSERLKGGHCEQRSVNVFIGGKSYFLFFLFAKADTKQTYQIYVGKDFKLSADAFKGIRITGTDKRFTYVNWADATDWQSASAAASTKPLFAQLVSEQDTTKVDPAGGILQVTVDFSKITDAAKILNPNPNTATNTETCKPAKFCSWKGAANCGCSLAKDDPRVIANPQLWGTTGQDGICAKTCKAWAVKAIDCPEGGCFGFSFTLPASAKFADDSYHRPQPDEIDITTKPWNLRFTPVGSAVAGAECFYDASTNKVPDPASSSQCKVSDCGMGEKWAPFCSDTLPKTSTSTR